MSRLQISGMNSVAGNTTKEITIYAPIGFRVVSAGYEYTTAGAFEIMVSRYVLSGNRISTSGSTVGYMDGATDPAQTDGWYWKVRNVTGSSAGFYVYALLEEDDGQATLDYANSSWPVTAV